MMFSNQNKNDCAVVYSSGERTFYTYASSRTFNSKRNELHFKDGKGLCERSAKWFVYK